MAIHLLKGAEIPLENTHRSRSYITVGDKLCIYLLTFLSNEFLFTSTIAGCLQVPFRISGEQHKMGAAFYENVAASWISCLKFKMKHYP